MKNPLLKCLCGQSNNDKIAIIESCCCFLSEFIGTAMLMFLGCMGCLESDAFESNNLTRALNFGLVVLIIIQCFGCCSGAHLNPSITVSAYIYNKISLKMVFAYIAAQMLGAFCGYGLLKLVLPMNLIQVPGKENALCMTAINSHITKWQGLGIEIFITSALIWATCGVWDPRNKTFQDSVAIRFGLAVASLSMTAGPITGASMNPARSLAPAIWNNQFENQWVYWVGPLFAAVVATHFYKFVFRREDGAEKKPITKMEQIQVS